MKVTTTPPSLSGQALALGELSSAIFEAAVDAMIVIDQFGTLVVDVDPDDFIRGFEVLTPYVQ